MKYLIPVFLLLCSASVAFGQLVNPTIIYQDTDIALHHTDVYYSPFAPPNSLDTRANFSCISYELNDPDGVLSYTYAPITHTMSLGPSDVWMRLFTANDKPSGAHSDIIVGNTTGTDSVIISKNEDVDFRATGTIKMEAGFHVMPGAFFHAYIAPAFDTTVFSDEFDSSTIDRKKWFVTNGHGPHEAGPLCSFDTNLVMVADPDAHDGHALRMDMKEDSCSCLDMGFAEVPDSTATDCDLHPDPFLGCNARPACIGSSDAPAEHYAFSTVVLESCPWPFAGDNAPLKPAYSNAPYGKWEVRQKTPAFQHHYNTYGDGQSNEWNTGETDGGTDDLLYLHPGLTRRLIYGPCHGRFYGDTLRCFDSALCFTNNPNVVVINSFPYEVALNLIKPPFVRDTFMLPSATTHYEGGFPSSLTSSTDTVTFYYIKRTACVSDILPWHVDSGSYFSGAYAVDHLGHPLFFGKSYQPISITLHDSIHFRDSAYPCHWDHNTGEILLTVTMDSTAPHSGYGFTYTIDQGPDYPVPKVAMDTSQHGYHTFTMEFLPHEARILIDGHVMRRFPDHLIPIGDIRYDYVTTTPRAPMNIAPGEFDLGNLGTPEYTFEKADFESKYGIGGTASQYLDYVKVWDLPAGSNLPGFPH